MTEEEKKLLESSGEESKEESNNYYKEEAKVAFVSRDEERQKRRDLEEKLKMADEELKKIKLKDLSEQEQIKIKLEEAQSQLDKLADSSTVADEKIKFYEKRDEEKLSEELKNLSKEEQLLIPDSLAIAEKLKQVERIKAMQSDKINVSNEKIGNFAGKKVSEKDKPLSAEESFVAGKLGLSEGSFKNAKIRHENFRNKGGISRWGVKGI